jgi:arabinofuranosyltransferase
MSRMVPPGHARRSSRHPPARVEGAWIGPAGSRYSAQVLDRQAPAAAVPAHPAAARDPRRPHAAARRWRARASAWAPPSIAAAVLLARFAALYDRHLIVDDAYISFRYADNLVRGWGLVYNPGERVEGYSNFLWTILLAAGARLGLDVVQLSVVLALGAALATVALLWVWSRRLFGAGATGADGMGGALLAALPPVLYAATGSQARYAVSGMETLLFGLLVAAAAYLLTMRDSPLAAGCVFALAAMTRPEGALYGLVAGCLVLLPVLRAGPLRSPLLLAGGFLALFVPYFAWRWSYYGYPLPNTFYAKVGGLTWPHLARGGEQLAQVSTWWSVYPLLIVAAAALPSRWANTKPQQTLRLAAAFVAVTAASFVVVGGDYLAFFGPRFLMPALPFLLLLASAGLGSACRRLGGTAGGRRAVRARRIAVAAAGALLLLANALWLAWPARYFDGAGLAELMAGREELGRYLGAATAPGTVMADGSAGIVPYLARRVNIDMFGLADLHIGHMTPLPIGPKNVAHEKYDPRYVLRRRPDLLITYLDRGGVPKTAGLPRVKDWVWACYRPLVLLRAFPGRDGSRLLPSRVFTAELFDAGYATTVLERRHGDDAARCAAYDGN